PTDGVRAPPSLPTVCPSATAIRVQLKPTAVAARTSEANHRTRAMITHGVPKPSPSDVATSQIAATSARNPVPPKSPGATWTYSFAKRPRAPWSPDAAMRWPSTVHAIDPPNHVAAATTRTNNSAVSRFMVLLGSGLAVVGHVPPSVTHAPFEGEDRRSGP